MKKKTLVLKIVGVILAFGLAFGIGCHLGYLYEVRDVKIVKVWDYETDEFDYTEGYGVSTETRDGFGRFVEAGYYHTWKKPN